MQVRVHRDHGVEQSGQELAHDLLADGFAGVEGDVLPHIGHVRGHQRQVLRAQCSRGAGRQQEFNQFVVGLVQ